MTAKPEPHPDDIAERHSILDRIDQARTAGGYRVVDVVAALDISDSAYHILMSGRRVQVRLSSLQRLAWAIGHTLRPRLAVDYLPDDLEDPAGRAAAAMESAAASLDELHMWQRARLVARLAAARRWLDMSAARLGQVSGIAHVCHFESGRKNDMDLSTPQRYARAVRGRLSMDLHPGGPA